MTQQSAQTPKSAFPVWLIIVIALPLLLCGLGVFSSLAVYGVRKYMVNAKTQEGIEATAAIARGIARCAAESDGRQPRGLPETAPSVPRSLSDVRGVKYTSAPAEWSAPAYTCAGFAMSGPQYFQYQWVRTDAANGTVLALADLNGDGMPEVSVQSTVACDPSGRCTASAPVPGTP